ncbi:MAG: protein kinase [Planctomycetota bacterium]
MFQVPGHELVERLDRHGSQGFVFKAIQLDLERPVAIKIVPDRMGASASERVLREAQAIARLNGDHVVVVYGHGRGPGFVYMTMEYLAGDDLETVVRKRIGRNPDTFPAPDASRTHRIEPGPELEATLRLEATATATPVQIEVDRSLAPAALRDAEWIAHAVDLGIQVCRGLDALHHANITHRDVKPANVMLVGERAKIIDFGISRRGWTVDERGRVLEGTPAFMAPEQSQLDVEPDARTDLFGLGATLFFLLTGRAPFSGDSLSQVVHAVRHTPTPRVRSLNPAVPSPLAAIVDRLLQKDPGDRYPSAQHVLTALLALSRERPFGGLSRRSMIATATVAAAGAWYAWSEWRRGSSTPTAGQLAATLKELIETVQTGDVVGARRSIEAMPEGVRRALSQLTQDHYVSAASQAIVSALLRSRRGVLRLEDTANCLWYVTPVESETDLHHRAPARLSEFQALDEVGLRVLEANRTHAVYVHQDRTKIQDWADGSAFAQCLFVRLPSFDEIADPTPTTLRVPVSTGLEPVIGAARLIGQAGLQQFLEFRIPGQSTALEISAVPISANVLSHYHFEELGRDPRDPAARRVFAHPSEPAEFLDSFLRRKIAVQKETINDPIGMDFWTAHRICAWLGCRLPTSVEWQAAVRAHPEIEPPDDAACWLSVTAFDTQPQAPFRSTRDSNVPRDANGTRIQVRAVRPHIEH